MAFHEQLLERRARQLSEHIKGQVESATRQMGTPSRRPPFHDQLTPKEALLFWAGDGTRAHPGHRYDAIGQQVLETWTPIQVAQLDAWINAATQATNPHLQPTAQPQPFRLPSGDVLYNQAVSSEKRIEGPPLGAEVA